jgi:hypothetical protein
MEPEAMDDTELLSAIERAWPVPPMTGQLINRDVSSLAIEPQSGSFSAPLAMPRIKTRRTWSSLTRIAAVLALLLTSVVGVIAFNNRSENDPLFSIAAPSPYESACALPLRSRDELIEIVTDVKQKIDTGKMTVSPPIEPEQFSIFDVKTDGSGAQEAVDIMLNAVGNCQYAGVNPARIKAVGSGLYLPQVASLFGKPNLSVDAAVDRLMSPWTPGGTPVADPDLFEPIQTEMLIGPNGEMIAALDVDAFGDRYGYAVQQSPDGWQWNGVATIGGEWSSLNITGSIAVTECPPSMILSDEVLSEYSHNQAWRNDRLPLIASLTADQLGLPKAEVATDEAVRATIDQFRQCLSDYVQPYRFALSTETFFGEFAAFIGAGPNTRVEDLGRASLFVLPIMPSVVTSVVKIDQDTALAVLAVDQRWQSTGKVPAIILVNVDGQWLINQLAIVEGPTS